MHHSSEKSFNIINKTSTKTESFQQNDIELTMMMGKATKIKKNTKLYAFMTEMKAFKHAPVNIK